jgi:type IV pilus assembly protein PilO
MDMKKILSDLQNINPKDPGGWPWAVKGIAFAAIFVAGLAAGWFVVWQDQVTEYTSKQDQEEKYKVEFKKDKVQAINLDLMKKQLEDTKQSFNSLLKQLPNKAEMADLLRDINKAGLDSGLQFDLFRPDAEVVKGMLTEQPISIKVAGSYDDFGKFASDVSQLSRIVILHDISLSVITGAPAKPGSTSSGSLLSMDAIASTYRYNEKAESAAKPGGPRP